MLVVIDVLLGRCSCVPNAIGQNDRFCVGGDETSSVCGAIPVASAVLLLENTRSTPTGCYPFGLKLSQAIPCYAATSTFRGKLTFPLATEWLV
uniref:Uncharacterized protein n=1 Tax=Anopheles minimus TaxID=112268 RepID=A0A182W2F6_9DIPT